MANSFKYMFRMICGVLIVVCSTVSNVGAQDEWIEPLGGFFDVGSNWADGSAPVAGESALFGILGPYSVSWDSVTGDVTNVDATINQGDVSFNNTTGTGADFTYFLTSDLLIDNQAELQLNDGGNPNNLNVEISNFLNINGQLEALAGTDISMFGSDVGSGDSGVVLLNGPGTTMDVGGAAMFIGVGAFGTVFIEDGAVLNDAGSPRIGSFNGAGGVVVSGAGSEYDVSGNLSIGNVADSRGQLQLFFGGNATIDGDLLFAFDDAGVSTVPNIIIIGGGSIIDVGDDLLAGVAGDAEIVMSENSNLIVANRLELGPMATLEGNGTGVPVINAANIENAGSMTFSGTGTDIVGDVLNSGTITSEEPSLNIFLDDFENEGTVLTEINAETRVLGAASGTAPYSGPGLVSFFGTVRPGTGSGVGNTDLINVIGDARLAFSSTLELELGSSFDFDAFWVDNDLTIDAGASLSISTIGGFIPSVGDQFIVVCTWGVRTGTFDGLPEGETVMTIAGVDLKITYTAGADGMDVALNAEEASILLGDVNLDGIVSLLDVQPFVNLIATGGYQAEADINLDGFVDLLDVGPFVAILTGI